jgi:hypothetical protein
MVEKERTHSEEQTKENKQENKHSSVRNRLVAGFAGFSVAAAAVSYKIKGAEAYVTGSMPSRISSIDPNSMMQRSTGIVASNPTLQDSLRGGLLNPSQGMNYPMDVVRQQLGVNNFMGMIGQRLNMHYSLGTVNPNPNVRYALGMVPSNPSIHHSLATIPQNSHMVHAAAFHAVNQAQLTLGNTTEVAAVCAIILGAVSVGTLLVLKRNEIAAKGHAINDKLTKALRRG